MPRSGCSALDGVNPSQKKKHRWNMFCRNSILGKYFTLLVFSSFEPDRCLKRGVYISSQLMELEEMFGNRVMLFF